MIEIRDKIYNRSIIEKAGYFINNSYTTILKVDEELFLKVNMGHITFAVGIDLYDLNKKQNNS